MTLEPARPRVLVLATWYPSQERPGEAPFNARHVQAIARVADVRVIHLRLGSGAAPLVETVDGTRVERLPYGRRRPLASVRALARIARAARAAEIVHTMAFPAAVVAVFVPFRRRTWVHTEHSSTVFAGMQSDAPRAQARKIRRVLGMPRWVTVVSTRLEGSVASAVQRVSVVSNVVPVGLVKVPPVEPPLRLVSVGGLVDIKQPLMAVHTLARLVEDGSDARLVWVGDGPLREAMLEEAAALGVVERLELPGTVAPAQVKAYLDAAHVFFLPTLVETFLVAGAEAIAAGRPVVLGGHGGFTDYVTSDNGTIVPEHSPGAYAEAILEVHRRLSDVNAVAQTLTNRFSVESVADEFAAVYREVLSGLLR